MIVADTDVLIDFLNGKGPVADRVALELSAGLSTTAITRFELLSGARTAREIQLATELLEVMPCLPVDAESAEAAAAVHRKLAAAGDGMGMADSLIAGIAIRHDAVLLTRNRNFSRVPELKLGTLRE